MSVFAELHDGRRLEFPDGTDPAVIQRTVKRVLGGQAQQPQQPDAAEPKKLGTPLDYMVNEAKTSIFPSVAFGGGEVAGAILQKLGRGAEAVTGGGALGQQATKFREWVEEKNKRGLENYKANFDPAGTVPNAIARGAGQAIATAPLTPSLAGAGMVKSALGGAGIGAGSSLMTPDYNPGEDFWKQQAATAGKGALLGGGLSALFGGLGRLGTISDDAGKLFDKGVRVTPGRAAGTTAKRFEEGAESVPIFGDMIRNKHRRAVEDWNRATMDDALSSIGEKVSAVGRSGVKQVRTKISAAYNSALDEIGTVPLTPTFAQEGQAIAQRSSELGKSTQEQFSSIVKNRLFARVENGALTAEKMKTVDSELGYLARQYHKSASRTGDQNTRGLANAIGDLQKALRANVEEVAGPELAQRVKDANTAWAKYVRIEDASTRAGSKEGIFSPAALRSAVQKPDKSKMATGDALMQDWAERGERVLGPTVPDSGTPYRLLATSGLLGYLLDPSVAATGAGMALMTSGPGQAAAIQAMKRAPQLTNAAPYLGLLSGPLVGR